MGRRRSYGVLVRDILYGALRTLTKMNQEGLEEYVVLEVTNENKEIGFAVKGNHPWNYNITGDEYDGKNRGMTEVLKDVCDW